ncbi:hypothetical protein ACKWTF_015602 [Chironomus riparius]
MKIKFRVPRQSTKTRMENYHPTDEAYKFICDECGKFFNNAHQLKNHMAFDHYRDLWKFSIAGKKWEHVKAPNGPSARSGHKMILHKERIILFGGFHDNNQSFLYFHDVWMFSMDKYAWTKVDTEGIAPTTRSGVGLGVVGDDKIVVFGGYTKSSAKGKADYHLCGL